MYNVKEYLLLRKVNINDENLLFSWANDFVVRKGSFGKKKITLSGHKTWFKQKIFDKNILIWILEDKSMPLGMVRLEKEGNRVLLNYLIDSKFRGERLASKMLIMAMKELNHHWRNVKVLAYTLPDNIASIKSLVNAGFILETSSAEKKCYVFNNREIL